MAEVLSDRMAEIMAQNAEVQAALNRATRTALLEHARMGNPVCESDRNGGVVWITPEEIFARYGLDENGKPKT